MAKIFLYPTMDGYVGLTGATWAGVRDAASGSTATTTAISNNCYTRSFSGTYYCYRAFFTFNTAVLGGLNATITGATLRFVGQTTNESLASFYVVEGLHTDPTTLTVDDYSAIGSTAWSAKTVGIKHEWVAISLNADGLAGINPDGITKIALRHSHDFENQSPSDIVWAGYPLSMETTNTPFWRPFLEIDYTMNAPIPPFISGWDAVQRSVGNPDTGTAKTLSADQKFVSKYTTPTGPTQWKVRDFNAYISGVAAQTYEWRYCIYDDSGNAPNNLIWVSDTRSTSIAATFGPIWDVVKPSSNVLLQPNTLYWIGIHSGSTNMRIYGGSTLANTVHKNYTDTFSDGTDDPCVQPHDSSGSNAYNAYVTLDWWNK